MKRDIWLKIQRNILELKSGWLLFLIIIAVSYIGPIIPELTFVIRFILNLVGLILIAIVYVLGNLDRTKKQTYFLYLYFILFIVGCLAAFYQVKPVHLFNNLFFS